MDANKKPKKRRGCLIASVTAAALVIIPAAAFAVYAYFFAWRYSDSDEDRARLNQQISYQFQELNQSNPNHAVKDEDYEGLPTELKMRGVNSGMQIYKLSIDGTAYDLYDGGWYDGNYYLYRAGDAYLVGVLDKKYDKAGFLVKDNCLYYRDGTAYKSLDVPTGQESDITKEAFERSYYALEPPPVALPEKGKYKEIRYENKNTARKPTNSMGALYTPWFYYNDEYYFISPSASAGSILCKYDAESETYVKIARMAIRPEGLILEGDYIYYCYGRLRHGIWGVPRGDPNSITQKQLNYARLSLVSLENETVPESAYLNVQNKY